MKNQSRLFLLFLSIFILQGCYDKTLPQDYIPVEAEDKIFLFFSDSSLGIKDNYVQLRFSLSGIISAETVDGLINPMVQNHDIFNRKLIQHDHDYYWQSVNELNWNYHVQNKLPVSDIDFWLAEPLDKKQPLWKIAVAPSGNKSELLVYWHHVMTDIESMLNMLNAYLWTPSLEMRPTDMPVQPRTKFGYEHLHEPESKFAHTMKMKTKQLFGKNSKNPGKEYPVIIEEIALGNSVQELALLGDRNNLSLNEIFMLIATNCLFEYHKIENLNDEITLLNPLTTRTSSLSLLTGNKRAFKELFFSWDRTNEFSYMKTINQIKNSTLTGNYKFAGKGMTQTKKIRQFMLKEFGPDYISNYFPLSDHPVYIGKAKIEKYLFNVPMIPYERCKFAWSTYDNKAFLFLTYDPELINSEAMKQAFNESYWETIKYLSIVDVDD